MNGLSNCGISYECCCCLCSAPSPACTLLSTHTPQLLSTRFYKRIQPWEKWWVTASFRTLVLNPCRTTLKQDCGPLNRTEYLQVSFSCGLFMGCPHSHPDRVLSLTSLDLLSSAHPEISATLSLPPGAFPWPLLPRLTLVGLLRVDSTMYAPFILFSPTLPLTELEAPWEPELSLVSPESSTVSIQEHWLVNGGILLPSKHCCKAWLIRGRN